MHARQVTGLSAEEVEGGLGLEFRCFGEAQFALSQGSGEDLFYLGLFAVAGHGQFADKQVAGALQHLFLAKRKRLRLMQGDQALQDAGYLEQRTGAHAVGVFFEAVFPVAVASIFADGKNVQNLLDFAVANHAAQADAASILAGYHHFEAAGFYVEEVKLFDCCSDGATADLFNNANAVIGIDNLVADMEIQVRTAHV